MYPLFAQVSFNPTMDGLPGGEAIQRMVNTLGAWTLVACLVGVFLSVAYMALGSHSNNHNQSVNGRRGLIVSSIGALLIGGAPTIVNFFFNAGRGLR